MLKISGWRDSNMKSIIPVMLTPLGSRKGMASTLLPLVHRSTLSILLSRRSTSPFASTRGQGIGLP